MVESSTGVILCSTSSTAQGGGGSFKKSKTIGEIVVSHGCQSKNTD